MKSTKKRVLALVCVLAMCISVFQYTSIHVLAEDDEYFSIERNIGKVQYIANVKEETRVVYCMEYQNAWPIDREKIGSKNPEVTRYRDATREELRTLLNDETGDRIESLRRLLFAGYPYDGIGAFAPAYNWGEYLWATFTEEAVWFLMSYWGVPNNKTYAEKYESGNQVMDDVINSMIEYALNGAAIPESLPEDFVPQLTGNTNFSETDGGLKSGSVQITNPNGFILRYDVVFPKGVTPVDKDGQPVGKIYDFYTGAVGYSIYGGEDFYLKAEKVECLDDATIVFRTEAKIPTDIRHYLPKSGEKVWAAIKGTEDYEYLDPQAMLSIGILSEQYTGEATLAAPGKTNISVKKQWIDSGETPSSSRPEVKVYLVVNDVKDTEKCVTLNANNRWGDFFTNLDVLDDDGNPIHYSVEEETVDGYVSEVTGDSEVGFTIVNTETTSISGTKVWKDEDDKDGSRPESITVHLMNGETIVETKTVTADDKGEWKWTFEDVKKYDTDGELISYSFTEEEVDGYETSIEGTVITNTHNPKEESSDSEPEESKPSDDSNKPTEESSKSEDSSKPSEESSKPNDDSSKPSEESSKPGESSKPSEESSKPAEESSKPTEESSKPTEESSKPEDSNNANAKPNGDSDVNGANNNSSTTTTTPSKDGRPDTGDRSQVEAYLVMLMASMMGVVVSTMLYKKERKLRKNR